MDSRTYDRLSSRHTITSLSIGPSELEGFDTAFRSGLDTPKINSVLYLDIGYQRATDPYLLFFGRNMEELLISSMTYCCQDLLGISLIALTSVLREHRAPSEVSQQVRARS